MHKNVRHCLNCNNVLNDNFCSKCGQSARTSRVNAKHLAEELQYGLLHINKGLLYTTKELLLRPGMTIKNYLAGKRVKYTKPFLFLIVWGVIYSLIFHFFHFFPLEEMNKHDGNIVLEYIPVYNWYFEHYSLVLLVLIPFYAFFTYLLFHKQRYNYIEHLVLFSYISGARILILLIFYPIIYFTKSILIYKLVFVLSEIYVIWGLVQFFKTSSWLTAISKVILGLFLALILMLVIIAAAFIILSHFDLKL
ncbi:MAG: DUF3667 domain-containing protein [Prevotella sp.]|jgi:hypothetical protein|nr:DUF3667 domain-containing protein [Prevotella sp.]